MTQCQSTRVSAQVVVRLQADSPNHGLQALKKDVPAEDLERAKNAAISQVLVNLESRAVISEDIGRQVLTYGHRWHTSPALAASNMHVVAVAFSVSAHTWEE